MNTYELKVSELKVIQLDSMDNVVCDVSYRYTGTSESGKVHHFYGSETLDTSSITDFVEFNNLDEQTVVGWLEAKWHEDHVARIKNIIDSRLAELVPTQKRAPWEPELVPGVNAP